MGLFRLLKGPVAALALLLIVAALLALPASAVSDRSPGGSGLPRLSLFHVALVLSDPFVWTSLRQSLVGATVVAFASMIVGVSLARLLDRRRFWGRPLLSGLVWLPGAYSPMFAALGAAWLLGPIGPLASGDGSIGSTGRFLEDWGAWLAWFWVETAFGVPWVALAVLSALRRVDASWLDAARQQGASRRQVWKGIIWPIVRPAAARASATVFALVLLEPGAPIVLGLRRTLPFQIVEAAIVPQPDQGPRVAALALIGLAVALLGRLLIGWWGGSEILGRQRSDVGKAVSVPHRDTLPGSFLSKLVLLAWGLLALAPSLAVPALWNSEVGGVGPGRFGPLADLFGGAEVRRLLVESVVLGLTVAGLNLLFGWSLAGSLVEGAVRKVLQAIPPLILGVSVLLVPSLLEGIARHSGQFWAVDGLSVGLDRLAVGLDPYRSPGVLLTLGVAMVQLPWLIRASNRGRGRWRPTLFEASTVLGASKWRTWRTVAWPLAGPPLLAAWLLTAVLAASALTPALLLTPTSEARPIALGVLRLRDDPDAQAQAAALATIAMILSAAVLPIALRDQDDNPGEAIRV